MVQLGHERGTCCPNPAAAPLSFLIMHTNGFHPVTIQFCLCNQARQAGNRYEQLLRAELLPSTTVDPSTCCTFRMLEQFHLLTLQSKITAYDYYTTLTKLTDNTRIGKTYVSLFPTPPGLSHSILGSSETVPTDGPPVAPLEDAQARWSRSLPRWSEHDRTRRAMYHLPCMP